MICCRALRLLMPSLLLLGALAVTSASQTIVHTSSIRAYHSAVGPRLIVRDKAGYLYTVFRDQMLLPSTEWRLGIARSTDGGKTWTQWQTGFDSNPAGDYGNAPCSLAIDSQENLHVAWSHNVTGYQNCGIRYNRWDKATQTWGGEVTIVGNGYGRTTAALAIDSKDYVWMVHSTTTSWRCIVSRSDKPLASDLKFTPTTPAFSSNNCQHASMVVDALDRIHISYYSTGNGDTVHHHWLDPSATTPTWTQTPLGNVNLSDDEFSSMAADLRGNVYIVYGNDTQRSTTLDPNWELRKWDGATQAWSAPLPFYKTTHANFRPGVDGAGQVICMACDESANELYFAYRNYESGKFLLARWRDGDPAPTTYATLATTGSLPANTVNYFLYPNFRGSLYPSFNRTAAGLDLIYCVGDQTATQPKYDFVYDAFPLGALSSSRSPQIGTTFVMDLVAVQDGGKPYVTALCVTGLGTVIAIDRRFVPLLPDAFLYVTASNALPAVFQNFAGVLSTAGAAQAAVAIPNIAGLVGVKAHTAYLTYPGGPQGIHTISNPFTFVIGK